MRVRKIVELGLASIAIVLALSGVLRAQEIQGASAAAPVPVQIIDAKKVFISNGGADTIILAAYKRAEQPDQGYNQFYAAMKNWGRYELVAAPAGADLVFEIRFVAPMSDCGKVITYEPQLQLTIADVKTHFELWMVTEPVQTAFRKATWDKNVDQGVTNLLADIKKLAAAPESISGTANQ
ncbi:MAG: hypothetical protein WBD87_11805 [Candidatus Acidiferrales bacterium]